MQNNEGGEGRKLRERVRLKLKVKRKKLLKKFNWSDRKKKLAFNKRTINSHHHETYYHLAVTILS